MKIVRLSLLLTIIWLDGITQSRYGIDSIRHELAIARHDTSRVNFLELLGGLYWTYKPDSALFFTQKALDLAREIRFSAGESNALTRLGLINNSLGNSPKALEMFFKALQVAKKNNLNGYPKAHAIYNIGWTYLDLKDYSNAAAYMLEAKVIFDSLGITNMGLLVESSVGQAYLAMNDFDSALKYSDSAYNHLIQYKKMGGRTDLEHSLENNVLNDLGLIYTKMGNASLALKYFRESLGYSIKYKNYIDNAISYYGIAKIYQQEAKVDSSLYYARKSLAQAQTGSFYVNIIEASNLLTVLLEKTDPQKALGYNKIANAAKDSLFSIGKRNAYKNLMDFDVKERQYEIETATITYQNKVRLYAFLVGIAIFFIIAFILYRNNQKEKKAKHQLQAKNQIIEQALTHLKSTQSQLIQSEKMASLGELTAGIAHEIQNPLNFVNNFSELSSELITEMNEEIDKGNTEEVKAIASDIRQNLEKINHHGKRADSIVKGMLQHSQKGSGQKEPTDINALAEEYLRLSYHGTLAKDITLNASFVTDLDKSIGNVNLVQQDISRVLLNLYNNAFCAVAEKQKKEAGDYQPTVTLTTKRKGGFIEINIKDNGSGIPESIKDKIFQPFFTTKPTGKGTGLGLSLSYDIVKANGGELKVETKEGEGSEFIVLFPI